MELMKTLIELMKSALEDKIGEILVMVTIGTLIAKAYKRYKPLFIVGKITSERLFSNTKAKRYIYSFISLFICIVVGYLYKTQNNFYTEGLKAFNQYWSKSEYKYIIIGFAVMIIIFEVLTQVIKKKYPNILKYEKINGTIDSHYEQILSDFENDNITFEDYLDYKKINKVVNYKKEQDVMFAKYTAHKIVLKQYNKYLKLENSLRHLS